MAYRISCLCRQVAQEVQLDPSIDDTIFSLCHCNACRATTGLLFSSYYTLQGSPQSLDGLREYQQPNRISRYFCSTCGAHVFAHRTDTDRYFIAAGVFADRSPPIQTMRHWQTIDTKDGGLSVFLPGDKNESCCLLQGTCGNPERDRSPEADSVGDSKQDHGKVRARCHCGGVEFYVTPPDSTSSEATSPWPDLLVPYHSRSSSNPDDVKWWLCEGNTRYLAGTCACTSCRLGSGFPIQEWAFIPKSNLLNADSSPLAFHAGTMQQYESSPEVYREFCNRCGATVFWHCEERPLLIDVSVGLLQAQSGARAEELLHWHRDRVSFAEMGQNQTLVERLEAGLSGGGW
ncbi:Mss4-like protein [Aspergillus ambiguus]|uniref:GFA family protein n=1 Tax=Aspergillus ambiguus TaxID=176160 RepID=UPI003CCCAC28